MVELDARDLKCPLPVLRARKMLNSLKAGEELVILVTDEAAPRDLEVFCSETGHKLVSKVEIDNCTRLILRCRDN
ncbi:MAG: sulfurtransferase TusA family protein [Rhodospirillaceae bacterium]|jgi:tRNA 2-thiouridine synthesizing protein A